MDKTNLFKKSTKLPDKILVPKSSKCIPSFHICLLEILSLEIKPNSFYTHCSFEPSFTWRIRRVNAMFFLDKIDDVNTSFTPISMQDLPMLTLSRMGSFWAAHGWGAGGQTPPPLPLPYLKSVTHFLQWWNLAVTPYLKRIQKIYESRDKSPDFCWHQHFFTGDQKILLYQEIEIYITFWYIISNSFNFSWVSKHCFNKHDCNFDDVSKIGCTRPSQNKFILK